MTNIVVIAHDAKKPELAKFLSERLEWLKGVNLIATGRTAEFIESQGIKCLHMSPGQSGGYIQITDMIVIGEVDIGINCSESEVFLEIFPPLTETISPGFIISFGSILSSHSE